MANAQFENVSSVSRRFVGKIQTAQNIRLGTKEDISKVLSVGIDSFINSYEAVAGEASFFGKTNIRFLYSDGTTPMSASYGADFTDRLQSALITPQAKLSFDVVVVDYKTETNANTAAISLLLEVSAYAYVTENCLCLVGGDGMFCRSEDAEILSSAGIKEIPMELTEELTAKKGISSVLLAESSLCITDYSFSENIMRVTGDASLKLTYLSDGKIVSDVLPFKFSEELEAPDLTADSQLRVSAYIKNTRIRLDILEEEVNTVFTADINAVLKIEWTVTSTVPIVTDAYGPDCDFEFTKNRLLTTLPCGSVTARKKVDVTAPFGNAGSFVAAVNVSAVVTKCTSLEQQAAIEGILCGTVLYETESGLDSATVELPFAETVAIDYIMPRCESVATAYVETFDVKLGSDVSVSAELCFNVDSQKQTEYSVITAAEEIPFDKDNLPAIEVCIAKKGDTVWQLAKSMHMSEEDITALNPEITSPLEKDARIVVYNRI